MTSASIPAAPDLMTMLCRIGAGMREAVPSGVFMQFLLIGAMCPQVGAWLRAWLFVEERLAGGLPSGGAALPEDASDADLRSGWLSQEGPVWRWRQVTRFGSVLVIPVLWFVARDGLDGVTFRPGSSIGTVAGVVAGVTAGIAAGAIWCFVFGSGLARRVELRAICSGSLTKSASAWTGATGSLV